MEGEGMEGEGGSEGRGIPLCVIVSGRMCRITIRFYLLNAYSKQEEMKGLVNGGERRERREQRHDEWERTIMPLGVIVTCG